MIAVQSFCLRTELERDFHGTFQKLHEIGFDAFEPFVVFDKKQGNRPGHLFSYERLAQAKELLDAYGMKMVTAHIGIGYGNFFMPVGKVIRNIKILHEEFGVSYFAVSGLFADAKGAKKWARKCSKIAKGIQPFGCTLLYHNHDLEFTPVAVGGKNCLAMDYFLEQVDASVMLQPDIGWISNRCDEVLFIRDHIDRIVSLHLKDMTLGSEQYNCRNTPPEMFVPVGTGRVKTNEVLDLLIQSSQLKAGLVIDQDKSGNDMLQDMQTSFYNVQGMLQQ